MIYKYRLSFRRLTFRVIAGLLCFAEAFLSDVVPLVYFCFCCLCFWSHIQKIVTKTDVMGLLPVFSSRSFMASGHTFKSLIHVELIFVNGLRTWSSFMILCSPLIRDFAFWVSVT